MTKRTIDDIHGHPVEIEIDDAPPHDCLDEAIQALMLARAIREGDIPAPLTLPPYEHKYKRKKVK